MWDCMIDWRRALLRKRQEKIAHVVLEFCKCGVRGLDMSFFEEAGYLDNIGLLLRQTATYNTAFAQEIQAQFVIVLESHTVPGAPIKVEFPPMKPFKYTGKQMWNFYPRNGQFFVRANY